MKTTKFDSETELKALFEQALRTIDFYEAQRKKVLTALESVRRELNSGWKPPTT